MLAARGWGERCKLPRLSGAPNLKVLKFHRNSSVPTSIHAKLNAYFIGSTYMTAAGLHENLSVVVMEERRCFSFVYVTKLV